MRLNAASYPFGQTHKSRFPAISLLAMIRSVLVPQKLLDTLARENLGLPQTKFNEGGRKDPWPWPTRGFDRII
ncbi:hypothetical protein IQ26_05792 [Mesorhizobium tianshanense]|uniref:Uncharacterized protein n=1 Tax=Mesorhizobium tianshanense TaxID=39844 RepID=A0A562N3Z0_9HYPH|nr:hypothetical protein IQ26_05792 [Mesorhizobium tianshanense]